MMMSDLPSDLVDEILSRVPATSLKRLRSTCRRWNALFKDQRFTEKHSHKAAKKSMVLMLKEYRVCPISINLNFSPPYLEFQVPLGLKDFNSDSEQADIAQVFHCDGLLLCTTKDNRVVVWNPCLGETRWILLKNDHERNHSRFTLGYIQNNKSCRSYKILRWWSLKNYKQFIIYDLSSDSWRVFDDVVFDCVIECNGYSSGASSLKGNTYWLATDTKDKNQFILCFDFTAERFKHLCLPVFQNHGVVTLSVGREEQLSVLNWSSKKTEMWVSNKIDGEAELLWSKSFIVDLASSGYSAHIFMSLLIDEKKKVSLCCNIANSTGRDLVYTIGEKNECYTDIPFINYHGWLNQEWRPTIFHYVPNLFHIQ